MFDIDVMTRLEVVAMARWLFVNMDNKLWSDPFSKVEWYLETANGDDYKKVREYTGL